VKLTILLYLAPSFRMHKTTSIPKDIITEWCKIKHSNNISFILPQQLNYEYYYAGCESWFRGKV